MTAAVEKGAEALALAYDGPDTARDYDRDAARAVLVAALDVDDIARVVAAHRSDHAGGCSCGWEMSPGLSHTPDQHLAAALRHALIGDHP